MTFSCAVCGALARTNEKGCPVCFSQPAFMKELASVVALRPKRKEYVKNPDKPVRMRQLPTNGQVARLDMDPMGFGMALPVGTLTILTGDPGSGKSTLTLKSASTVKGDVLVGCSEESVFRVKDRASRIGASEDLFLYHTRSIFDILKHVATIKPKLLVLDSLNQCTGIESSGENASLVDRLQALADCCVKTGLTAIVISHVNADGDVYGPTTLEHTSDININVKVDEATQIRTVIGTKNRFYRTGVYARYKLLESGLVWVDEKGKPLEKEAVSQ